MYNNAISTSLKVESTNRAELKTPETNEHAF